MEQMTQGLLESLAAAKETMLEQLHQFCEINTGTRNIKGLETMLACLKTAFTPLADEIYTQSFPAIQTISMQGEMQLQQCGQALFIRKRPHLKRRILLCGHMDTVFDEDSSFQTLRHVDDNTINGPGVADMKGGLIVLLHALQVFEENPIAETLGWDVFINADEEIGSLASSLFYNDMAASYQAGLVYEPAMTPHGMLAKNRRGSGKLTLIATGKTAHAGRSFFEGRNAICYLAKAISAVHDLNGTHPNITINIGLIAGGTALNAVPDKAVAKMDVRITHPEDETWVRDKLAFIFKEMKHPDYHLTLKGDFSRPPKRINAATERLFNQIKTVGKRLNLHIDWQDSGGCCDGNNLSNLGVPVIDTLGVRGGNIHSPQEFILVDSLVERASLSALLLLHLAQGGLEELSS